ncbi:hypothetical protein RYX36_030299 [Vicia faba]
MYNTVVNKFLQHDLTKIPNELPPFLGYEEKDMLAGVRDMKVLLNDLQDHDSDKLVVLFNENYAHIDFIMGVTAKQIVYDPMIDFFNDC